MATKLKKMSIKYPSKVVEIRREKIEEIVHSVNKIFCEFLGDKSHKDYKDAPDWVKDSIKNGIKNILANPDTTPEQSHENWMRKKEQAGWKYGKEKCEIMKTHPCMVDYNVLPEHQKVKDKFFTAIVKTLLLNNEKKQ